MRPQDRVTRIIIHAHRVSGDGGGIVIAEQDDGPLRLLQFSDAVDDIDRIGPIANEIPQKHEPVQAKAARLCEAGVERLPIAVNVRQKADPHVQTFLPKTFSQLFEPAAAIWNKDQGCQSVNASSVSFMARTKLDPATPAL